MLSSAITNVRSAISRDRVPRLASTASGIGASEPHISIATAEAILGALEEAAREIADLKQKLEGRAKGR